MLLRSTAIGQRPTVICQPPTANCQPPTANCDLPRSHHLQRGSGNVRQADSPQEALLDEPDRVLAGRRIAPQQVVPAVTIEVADADDAVAVGNSGQADAAAGERAVGDVPD